MSAGAVCVLPRSFLYVPAVRPELFGKAASGPSDAVLLDLEDAVPPTRKDEARSNAERWLRGEGADCPAESWVRINSDTIERDLDAVLRPALDGIVLAKCTGETLRQLARALGEASRGLDTGAPRVIGLVESARGLVDLAAITGHPLLTSLGMGEVDLLADLRIIRSDRSAAAIDSLRTQLVQHCAAAGIAAPVAPTSTDFRDLDDFAETCRHLFDLGFRSRTAIHPAQARVINEVFTPSASQVLQAQDVVSRFESAAGGVTTDAEGRLIDAAVVRTARETLARRRP